MSFFEQLAAVARRVDKDVKELKDVADQPYQSAQREEELEEQERKATLLLRNMSTEVRDLKAYITNSHTSKLVSLTQRKVQSSLSELCSTGFLELVAEARTLVLEKQNCVDMSQREVQSNLSELRSNGFLELVAAARALVQKEQEVMAQTEAYLHKYGFQPLPSENSDRGTSGAASEEHGSRDETVVLSSSHFAVPQATAKATTVQSSTSNGLCFDSPVPPVLTTPGVKQIASRSRIHVPAEQDGHSDTPELPVLQTPGVKQIARHSKIAAVGEGEGRTDTPEVPVLQTPGVKQIAAKSVLSERRGPATPAPDATLRSVSDTPEMPELTFKFDDLQLLMAKYTNRPSGDPSAHSHTLQTKPPAHSHSLQNKPQPGAQSISQPMTSHSSLPVTQLSQPKLQAKSRSTGTSSQESQPTFHMTSHNTVPQPTLPVLQTTSDDRIPSPAMPVLHPISTMNVTLQSASQGPRAPAPALSSGYTLQRTSVIEEEEDIPFPEMPELVGTYNFTAMLNQQRQTLEDKENQAPVFADRTKVESAPEKKSGSISLITKEEYRAQPDYLTKNVTLDKLNENVLKLQHLLDHSTRDSSPDYITEGDIKELLGFDATCLLLCLTRLNKLVTVHPPNCSQPAYRPR